MSDMKLAFEMGRIRLSLADILPARLIKGPATQHQAVQDHPCVDQRGWPG